MKRRQARRLQEIGRCAAFLPVPLTDEQVDEIVDAILEGDTKDLMGEIDAYLEES